MRKKILQRPNLSNSVLVGLPGFLNRIYTARGVQSATELELSLNQLHRSETIKGLDKAVSLLLDALSNGQKILIVGDFDCDGATSTALAMLVLKTLKADCQFLVPNRFEYGYGLTPEIVDLAAKENPHLIVTVDNGISSIDGVRRAKQLGIKVLITDHHLPGDKLPEADAIVNPNQPGCAFQSKNAAGVGVIFYVMSGLRAKLRELDWFQQNGIPEFNMASYLDLLALGTVADLVPLDMNNRILVEQGLRRIRAGKCRPGIKALLKQAGKEVEQINASDMGFIVGPRLNAAGRLDDMSLGINCLLTDSKNEAELLAKKLDHLNQERKDIEHEMKLDAESQLDTFFKDFENNSLSNSLDGNQVWGLCLYQPHWHQGVIGILASRIKEKLNRPTIIFAPANDDPEEDNPILKGSARSIPGLHMRDTLDLLAKRYPQLLSKFGGHAMAAGMSIEFNNLEAFTDAFNAIVKEALTESDLESVLLTDGELSSEDRTLENIALLERSGPWGQAFPEPSFDGVFNVLQQRVLKEKHLKLVLSDEFGTQFVDAIHFNSGWCHETLPNKVRIVYRPNINEFRGKRSIQFFIDYLEKVAE
ncbi:MAG: single-stranded-DNA-specific exonuclease [Oleiphilaceae bacterium]|jgi:single-stranded-DNA-specific exonuclease